MKNIYDIDAELGTLTTELRELGREAQSRGTDLTGDKARRWDEITTRIEQLREEREGIERRAEEIRQLAMNPRHIEQGSATGPVHREDMADDSAKRVLDAAHRRNELPDYAAEVVEGLLHRSDPFIRRWVTETGNPAYRSAFQKICADPVRGHLSFTAPEADSFRRVEQLRVQQRAMGEGSGTQGGYMVPFQLDPAVLLSNAGTRNPLRRIARVEKITTNAWHGVSSAGATAEWIGEGSQVADASFNLSQPQVIVYKADAFVPFSFEVEQDAADFLTQLQIVLVDAADRLNSSAYTNGSGTGQPHGLITSLVATGGSSIVAGGGTTLAAADLYNLQNALPPRFQDNSQWMASLSVVNAARQFQTANGSLVFPSLQTNPPTLLGRAMNENSEMATTAYVTGSNYMAVVGDFKQFLIVDRIGSTLELVPQLFGTNGRPTGQRGALLWWRTGSDVLVPNAFRLLDVTH
ncbi:phage major capsid protein [Skermania sp. ID1734]|uniref:phage major capsid protein n=1 Tax=Skermania sp. ID1734 TaxID=2597516 RepID=UPI00163DB9BB|nr:phage major capsid protein [Skermania sp. ID1734]